MPKVEATERVNDFGLVGSLGRAYHYGEKILGHHNYGEEEYQIDKNEYGVRVYGVVKYGTDDVRIGVYHRTHKKGKVSYRRMKFYIPKNPRTAPQQTTRSNFTTAMSAWASLTNEQKAVYNERAKGRPLYGSNLFVREYLNSL